MNDRRTKVFGHRGGPGPAGLLVLLVLTLLAAGCRPTPQLGTPESLGAADALWTAITAKDDQLVNKSAERIDQLHNAGKLADDAYQSLQQIIATARKGEWDSARGALKTFVRGQRPAGQPK